jgi:hypothetical protein
MKYTLKTLSILFFTVTISTAFGSAFQAAQFDQMTNRNASLLSTQGSKDPNVISGSCEFDSGSCNGAEVNIYEDTKQIFTSTLISNGYFQTPSLSKNKSYKLVLTWPKYSFNETRNVLAGEFIVIKLNKP